jgi:hypothetical protein
MPTIRQKLVASKMVDNGGNLGRAMLEAGYSKAMAKNPYKLTRSKGWLELTQDLFSDEKLVEKHSELLDSVKTSKFSFPKSLSDQEICRIMESVPGNEVIYIQEGRGTKTCVIAVPDVTTQAFALNLAYRVKGYYNKPKNGQSREENDSLKDEVERIHKLFAGK